MTEEGKTPKTGDMDEMLRRARRLQAQTDTAADMGRKAQAAFKRTTIGGAIADLAEGSRFAGQVLSGLDWIYRKTLKPVTDYVLKPLFGWAWNAYKWVWDKTVYVKDEVGVPVFSKKRAAGMICATAGLAMAFNSVGLPAIWYGMTNTTETLYLTQSQEFKPGHYNVKGSHRLPFTDQSSIYFRVENSLFHDVWSFMHDGHPWFFSDFVAAAVPPGANKCEVHYYGMRAKLFSRYLEMYPTILSAKCQPIDYGSVSGPYSHAAAKDFASAAMPSSGQKQVSAHFMPVTTTQAAPAPAAP